MSEQIWWQSPGWFLIFFITAGVFGAMAGLIKWMFPKVDREKERAESIELAKSLSSFRQRVAKIRVYPPPHGMIVINLVADNEEMRESQIYFSRKHPDFEAIAEVTGFTVLSFSFQEKSLLGLNAQDASAYLRLQR